MLMLLIPADAVAVSTMNMMDRAVRTESVFAAVLVVLMFLAFMSLVRVQRSWQMVKLEQETNRELNQLRMVAESANAAKSAFLIGAGSHRLPDRYRPYLHGSGSPRKGRQEAGHFD